MYYLENNPLLGGISNKFREVGDISEEVVSLASFVFRGYCSVNDFPKKNHDKTEFRKCSLDRKSTRLNSSHPLSSRMPSSA